MIRLIALDLDGTLLDPAGRITQASKDAIARARAAGVRVVLNTGRPLPEAFWFVREAGCDSLVCALGGGAVADCATGRVIRRCIRVNAGERFASAEKLRRALTGL